jgi:hypothetical protein
MTGTVGEMLWVYTEGYRTQGICNTFEEAVAEEIDSLENGISNPKQFFLDLIRKSAPKLRLISYSTRTGFPDTDENNCSLFRSEFDKKGRIRGDSLKEDNTRYYFIQGKRNMVHTLEVQCE